MTDQERKAMEMALQALCSANPIGHALEDYAYHNKATEALRQALAQPEQYDQTTLELCDKCGWKTLIPDDCCLNCERNKQPNLRKAAEIALEALNQATGMCAERTSTRKDVDEAIEALRQALAQPDHWFDRTASHMAGEYVDTSWDTSDMAHRTGGLSVDLGTDRGAWSDVPDATKWVDELRGDEDSEKEPFCYHDGRNIVGKEFADHSDVFPLYTDPPLRQWQGLTEEDLFDIAIVNFGEPDLQLFIEMGKLVQEELKEKNT